MGNINALLLAAGYGTRLRPFTLTTQNAWLQLAGSQLLKIGLKHWKKHRAILQE